MTFRDLLDAGVGMGAASGDEHTRSGALKPTRTDADANTCANACARMPCARSSRPVAARRWRGWGCTASAGATTTPRRARRSKRSRTGTSSASCASRRRTAGSLVERAPFALLPGLWGGGSQHAVYRVVALPCLLAAAALGVWLVSRMRAQGASPLARLLALGVCVANPITLRALELGHPEELLGGCMCVAAALLAARSANGRDRSLLAGILLGLAIANKDWALVAAGPVLLALPPGRRKRCLIAAGATAGLVLAPLALVGSGGFVSSTAGEQQTRPTSVIFEAVAAVVVLRSPQPARARTVGSAPARLPGRTGVGGRDQPSAGPRERPGAAPPRCGGVAAGRRSANSRRCWR